MDLTNNAYYSDYFADYVEYLESDSELARYTFDYKAENVMGYLRNFASVISAWPFIISQERVAEIEQFISRIPGLLYKSMLLNFADDAEAFASYMNTSAFHYELLKQVGEPKEELLIRYDAMLTDGVFKLLEVNIGSLVGGWHHDLLYPLHRRVFELRDETKTWNLAYRRINECFFNSLCSSILKIKQNYTGNILCHLDEQQRQCSEFSDKYREIYNRVKPFDKGQMLFFTELEQIEFSADGRLLFEGQEIDVLLLSALELPQAYWMKAVSCYMRNTLIFPDFPVHGLLGNKLVLAVPHERKVLEQVSAEEKAFIQTHIPWTARLNAEHVYFSGAEVDLRQLLLENKDRFIIKKAQSFQGLDVSVGRFLEQTEWEQQIDRQREGSDWIAQEYCRPTPVVACDWESRLDEYDPVWGIFSMGNQYSGALIRGVGAGTGAGTGVINTARGAIEFFVYEEQALNKRLVI